MPYERQTNHGEAPEQSGASSSFRHASGVAFYRVTLWPHRSLSRRGFVWFIGLSAALIALPLLALLGTAHLWWVLPFPIIAIAAIWFFLERSYKDGTVIEELRLWSDRIELNRRNPRAPAQSWSANPYWVTVHLHPTDGPVENYITLRGDGREVEIGAFLSPEERLALFDELQRALANLPR